jgi:hypothetical protein
MAKTQLNSALKGISGGIDAWVYRRIRGKTVISPRANPSIPPTPAQLAVRERFREAAAYAKSALANPERRALYEPAAQKANQPIFATVVADYLKPPTVMIVDLTGYEGQVGDPIRIVAVDDVEVTAVNVAIRAEDLTVLEEGAAVFQNGSWVYTATTPRTAGEPVTITATAMDHPGHTGTMTESWS